MDVKLQVQRVPRFYINRLVEIDSNWNPRDWSEKLFDLEFDNQHARIFGIFENEDLLGYLIAHVVIDEAHIVSLGVDSQRRRQGLGRNLLQAVVARLRLESIRDITLDVRVSNIAARELYKSEQFYEAGLRRQFYSDNNEDGITMRRTLSL